jgi:small subunit ribosomal protein S21
MRRRLRVPGVLRAEAGHSTARTIQARLSSHVRIEAPGLALSGAESKKHPWTREEVNGLATVTLKDGESQENLLKRFRKQVMKERILSDARRKRWYISPSEMRRIQKQRAIRRARRRLRQREARMRTR